MIKMNKVIVIGNEHHNTLGVIRSLGEKGLSSDVILVTNEKKPFVGKSKYINKLYKVTAVENVVHCLFNNFRSDGDKPVIIACNDAISSLIDENSTELSSYFLLPGAEPQGQITRLMNKQVMADLAVSVGLEIPPSWSINKSSDISDIIYPCITKPILSKIGSKADIQICKTQEELNLYLNKAGHEIVQVQKFIDKDFEFQLIGCATNKHIIIPGYSHILRPCRGSNTSFLKYSKLKYDFCDLEACHKFIQKTAYRGLFSMEFLRDRDGKDFFMEINFRNDGNSICVTASGINLPYIWYLYSIGKDYTDELKKEVKTVYVMPEFSELGLLLRGQLSIRGWLSDMKKTDRFMDYDKNDPRPFWREAINKIHYYLLKNRNE